MMTRAHHLRLAAAALSLLIFDPHLRSLFAEMRAFCRNLPAALKGPLPAALQSLTPEPAPGSNFSSITNCQPPTNDPDAIRAVADLAALLDRRSPLGLCLRRSLTRYHFLRRAGVPVVLHFGAKFVDGKPDRDVTGHAWLTLNGQVYHEDGENWRGFTVMLSFPQEDGKLKS